MKLPSFPHVDKDPSSWRGILFPPRAFALFQTASFVFFRCATTFLLDLPIKPRALCSFPHLDFLSDPLCFSLLGFLQLFEIPEAFPLLDELGIKQRSDSG